MLNIFEKLGVSSNPLYIEVYHRVGPTSHKKVIISMSREKDADRVRRVKKILKGIKLESLKVDNPILQTTVCAAITNVYGESAK